MEVSKTGSETSLHRIEKYSWRLILAVAGTVMGTIVPNLVGAGSTATLTGAILVGLLSAIFTGEGPPTRAKAAGALLITIAAVFLTISGFTLADLVRGESVFGDRQYTFPVPDAITPGSGSDLPESAPSPPTTSSAVPAPDLVADPTAVPPRTTAAPTPADPPRTRTAPPTTPEPPRPTTTPPRPTTTLPRTTTTLPPTTTTPPPNPGEDEILEEGRVELRAEPGYESVEIDWWRKVSDGSGDLHMDENGIFTALGAQLSVIEDSPTATRARCAQVQAWVTRVDFATLHEGSQLCAQSRGGRYAMLQVKALPTSFASDGRFIFHGTTWAERF